MNSLTMGKPLIFLLPVLWMVACVGGSGDTSTAGIGGTGITTTGTITGFGSVFVNGIEFETDDTSFDVDDDESATEEDLDIGMVVTVTGTLNDDGVTGTASTIVYDGELTGPVGSDPVADADNQTKQFNVLGMSVLVIRGNTVFANAQGGFNFDSIARDDVVEVSGYLDGTGRLIATRIEKKGELEFGETRVAVRGGVSGLSGTTFNLAGLTVDFSTADLSGIPNGTISNGQYVEVKGTLSAATAIRATRIDLGDNAFAGDVENASIEGIVTEFAGANSFRVDGQRVDASSAVFEPTSLGMTLGNGDVIQVEGPVAGGVLQATKVEARSGETRISARVLSVSAGTVTMGISGQSVTVAVNSRTRMEDDLYHVSPFTLANIGTGDFLQITAYQDGGTVVATVVERGEPHEILLQGPIDTASGTRSSGSITILGITVETNTATEFEREVGDNDVGINGDDFYMEVMVGDVVKVGDENDDGIADEVEIED